MIVWTHVFLIGGVTALIAGQRWTLAVLLTGSLCSSFLYHWHGEPPNGWFGALDRMFARVSVVVFNGIGFALNPAPLMIVLIGAGFVCFVRGQAHYPSRHVSPLYWRWHCAFHAFAFAPTMMICVQLAHSPGSMLLPGDGDILLSPWLEGRI